MFISKDAQSRGCNSVYTFKKFEAVYDLSLIILKIPSKGFSQRPTAFTDLQRIFTQQMQIFSKTIRTINLFRTIVKQRYALPC